MNKMVYFKNLFFSYSSFIAQIAVTIVIIPYAVHALGEFEYGIFILFHTVLAYLGIANVGIPQALMRRLIKYDAITARAEISQLVSSVFYFYLGVMVIVGLFIALFAVWGSGGPLRLIADTPDQVDFLRRLALLVFLTFGFELLRQIFDTVIVARNKIYLAKLLLCVLILVRGGAMLLVLGLGWRIQAVVLAQMVVTGLAVLMFLLVARREMGFTLSPKEWSSRQLREILPDSFWYFISALAVLLIFHTDALVISVFVGISAITAYALVYRFVALPRHLLSNVVLVMYPEVAKMFTQGEYGRILSIHDKLLGYLSLFAVLGFGGLYFVGEWIFALWMGDLQLFDYHLFVIFLITNALIVVSIPATYFLEAVGWHRFSTSLSLGQGVLNLLLSIWLVRSYGVIGVAVATLVSFVLTNFVVNILYFRKRMKAQIQL